MVSQMKLILPICLAFMACSHEEVKQDPPPKVHHEAPPPEPTPTSTNPFEKVMTPTLTHEPTVNSKWVMVGEPFKMNDSWSFFTWRDTANHNTCYLYNVFQGNQLVGHGMSCVKE
jgi:hypothetical protein